jgi:hypothetical protein
MEPLVRLPELARFCGGPPEFHVTDLIKFRGNEGKATEDLCTHMIEISAQCLNGEFQALTPKMILITDFAERLLPYMKEKLNPLDTRLDAVVNHPLRIVVPYWSRPPHDEWARLIIQRLAI